MPIRFRCAYCNQLLGIARRKASTVVRCPTCSGQVVVPNPDPERDEEADGPAGPNLFEASDIDQVLQLPNPVPQPAYAGPSAPRPVPSDPPPAAWGAKNNLDFSAQAGPEPALVAQHPPGVLLSPTRLTLLVVGVILGLTAAFGGGVAVGKFLLK